MDVLFILFSANGVIMEGWVPGWSASPPMRTATAPARGSRSRTASTWRALPTTAGCPVVAEMAEPAEIDAAVVASAREGGARIVGKTGLTELCWSASGINHWSGTPVNPRDPRRLPGGSSSGSAVAVATGEADVGLRHRHRRVGPDPGRLLRRGRPEDRARPRSRSRACTRSRRRWTPWARSGADVAAVELGMRLLEPAFRVPDAPGRAGRGPDHRARGSTAGSTRRSTRPSTGPSRAAGRRGDARARLGRRRGAQRHRGAHRRRGVPGPTPT